MKNAFVTAFREPLFEIVRCPINHPNLKSTFSCRVMKTGGLFFGDGLTLDEMRVIEE